MSRPLQFLLRTTTTTTTTRRATLTLRPHRRSLSRHWALYSDDYWNSNSNNNIRMIHRREQSGLISSLSSWVKDVVRTKSLQPPNPVLVVQQSSDDHGLPQFSHMLPYHLEAAISEVERQYKIDLAELEVAISNHTLDDDDDDDISMGIVNKLDQMEASVMTILQVGRLFTELASPPDQLQQWQTAHNKSQKMVQSLPWRRSKLIYQALLLQHDAASRSLCLSFEKQGVHLELQDDDDDDDDDDDTKEEERARLQSLHQELQRLEEQLQQASASSISSSFNEASKSVRLQMVSDMYNMVGLSQVQAQQLGYPNVMAMVEAHHHHIIATTTTSDEALQINQKVAEFLRPHLPTVEVTLDEEAGAFLGGAKNNYKEPTKDQKELWKAKQSVKKLLYLHGVLHGIADFCEAMFGIRMEVVKDGRGGWNKNVQLIHLYDTDSNSSSNNNNNTNSDKKQQHLGTIYLDPFRDPYWRSETANELVMTSLFSRRRFQTAVPVAIVALKASPTWDDAPAPLTWEDTRDLLYQFGKALQLILTKQPQSTAPAPADVSEFMAAFMELWIQNDGFLQRLAQLSQDQFTFQPDTMEILRKDLQKQKAVEIMHSVFLGTLKLTVFTDFDPRGDETLAALQRRLAEQYIPQNVPDSSDLSHLLEIFQGEDEDEDQSLMMTAYSSVHSEVLAAMVYDKFQNTDLRDREEAKRLGRGIRELFLRETILTKEDVEDLCGKKVSPDALRQVYKF